MSNAPRLASVSACAESGRGRPGRWYPCPKCTPGVAAVVAQSRNEVKRPATKSPREQKHSNKKEEEESSCTSFISPHPFRPIEAAGRAVHGLSRCFPASAIGVRAHTTKALPMLSTSFFSSPFTPPRSLCPPTHRPLPMALQSLFAFHALPTHPPTRSPTVVNATMWKSPATSCATGGTSMGVGMSTRREFCDSTDAATPSRP
jgi:hypothetical protein